MKPIQTLLVTALMGLSFAASAQWQWLDKDGRKVFSDRPPPSDVQEKNILKRPGSNKIPSAPVADAAPQTEPVAGSASAAAPALPASGAKPTALEKELQAKKKLAQEAEAAKKKDAEEQLAKAKTDSCTRAKQAKISFETGGRISRINASGEREFMDDAAKAEELKRLQGIIAKDCK